MGAGHSPEQKGAFRASFLVPERLKFALCNQEKAIKADFLFAGKARTHKARSYNVSTNSDFRSSCRPNRAVSTEK